MIKNVQTDSPPQRRGELDTMGMFIVVGLVFFHTATIFYGGEFFIKNEPPSIVALVFIAFASLWGMPLMFLIAGMAIRYSLLKRTAKEFLLERVKRLLIPFVTGLLILLPPQVYFGLKSNPTYLESFFQFYPRFFNVTGVLNFPLFITGAPPDELFRIQYLYFLIYLFAFTVILLPFFILLRKQFGKGLVDRIGFITRPGVIFLLAVPIAVIEAALTTEDPGAWNRYAWATFIVYGFLIASDKKFERVLQKHRVSALVLGIVTFILYFSGIGAAIWIFDVHPWYDMSWVSLLIRFVKGVTSWCWVVAIMGFAIHISQRARNGRQAEARESSRETEPLQKLSFGARAAVYFKGAQLPFYILHQLPIVLIGFYVVQWEVHALIKYLVITLSSLVATLLLYDICVRRTAVTRFLFGIKKKGGVR